MDEEDFGDDEDDDDEVPSSLTLPSLVNHSPSLSHSHTLECLLSLAHTPQNAPLLPPALSHARTPQLSPLPSSLSLSLSLTHTHSHILERLLSPSLPLFLSRSHTLGCHPIPFSLSVCFSHAPPPPPQAHTPKCPLSLSKTLISVKTSPATLPFLSVKAPSLPLNLPPLPTSPHFFSLILHPPSSPPLSFFSPLFLFLNLYDPLLSHSLT